MTVIPPLMDNPLYEGSLKGATSGLELARCCDLNAVVPQLPVSVGESNQNNVSHRQKSSSLSSRDYEGIWRAVKEDVSKSTGDSVSALEDFKQFRQKLADLKRGKEGPQTMPTFLTFSGSARSLNLGSMSTRSLDLSPSRAGSPLKRLSVLTSRKGVRGLNPERDSHRVGLSTRIEKLANSMRLEGLFKLSNTASISPVTTDHAPSPSLTRSSADSTTAMGSKKSVSAGDGPDCPPGKNPVEVSAAAATEAESSISPSCGPRVLRSRARTRQQRQSPKQKTEKIVHLFDIAKTKSRCVYISLPMCYGANILD